MKNRDYFAKPIQGGGRSRSDYGRTKLQVDEPQFGGRIVWMLIVAMIVFFTIGMLL